MDNKSRIQMGIKVLALFLWAIAIIATCAGLWNAAVKTKQVEGFYIFTSIVAFIINGLAIYVRARSISNEYETDKKEGRR
jgi:dolichyl-phosphate-mannose--protein O-mannosyl transferase